MSAPGGDGAGGKGVDPDGEFEYTQYTSELELPLIASLIEKELSEPYIVYTYRFFLNQWPELCWLAWRRQRRRPSKRSSQDGRANSASSQSTVTTSSEWAEDDHKNAAREAVGVVVCKLDRHLKGERRMRGYIAMLSVHPEWRGQGVASRLVKLALATMVQMGAGEVVLETEVDNRASLALYERLGFMREKRLHSFYLNGKDCFRLVLSLPDEVKESIVSTVTLPVRKEQSRVAAAPHS